MGAPAGLSGWTMSLNQRCCSDLVLLSTQPWELPSYTQAPNVAPPSMPPSGIPQGEGSHRQGAAGVTVSSTPPYSPWALSPDEPPKRGTPSKKACRRPEALELPPCPGRHLICQAPGFHSHFLQRVLSPWSLRPVSCGSREGKPQMDWLGPQSPAPSLQGCPQ